LENTVPDFSLSGAEVLTAIVSIYLLAFIQAGATVFHQIESFSLPKSLLCHLSLLYIAYVSCYLLNSWIPFEPAVIFIFTAIFLAVYFSVWLAVVITIKIVSRRLNEKLN
jgi:hypothetical protein